MCHLVAEDTTDDTDIHKDHNCFSIFETDPICSKVVTEREAWVLAWPIIVGGPYMMLNLATLDK